MRRGGRAGSSPSTLVAGEAVGSFKAGSDLHNFALGRSLWPRQRSWGARGEEGELFVDCFSSTRESPQLGSGGRCGGEEKCQVPGVFWR